MDFSNISAADICLIWFGLVLVVLIYAIRWVTK